MKKVNGFVVGVVAFVAMAALTPVSAVSAFSLRSSSVGACLSISRTLAIGSRGSDVNTLQTFLVSKNYPGGGAWMITGYYGAATAAAVRDFQEEQNLPSSGAVDSATLAALSSCNSSSVDFNRYERHDVISSVVPTQVYPTYPNNGFTNTYGIPVLSSLSVNTGTAGNTVTIFGSGFDSINNVVTIGGVSIPSISSNGSTITFIIPQYAAAGTTNVTVSNSRGVSNALSFTVWSYPSVCNYGYGLSPYLYNYNGYNNYNATNCACGIYGNCNLQQNDLTNPTISYLSPVSGGVGTSVTVFGSGFSTSGNTIHFGNGIIAGVGSNDGRGVTFTVPAVVSGYGSSATTMGAYNVSVTNSAGYTSNALPFTVTSLASQGAPIITAINGPTTLATGSQGTWSLSVNNQNYYQNMTTSVNWGDTAVYNNGVAGQQFYPQASTAQTFTHTYYTPGTYTITFTVTNASGQSNTTTTTVSVSSSVYSQLSLISISPTIASVGTIVTLYGTGFTPYDNTIHFGSGGTMHVASGNNGTTLTYTIPQYLSPCDVQTSGGVCPMYAQLVTPGVYPISVTNGNGTTSTIYVTIR